MESLHETAKEVLGEKHKRQILCNRSYICCAVQVVYNVIYIEVLPYVREVLSYIGSTLTLV
jgi:hypothetical protein